MDRWRRYPAIKRFVVELQLLHSASYISSTRVLLLLLLTSSCSTTDIASVRGSAGVAGQMFIRAGSNTDRHVRYLAVTPGDAFRELKYLNAGFQHLIAGVGSAVWNSNTIAEER